MNFYDKVAQAAKKISELGVPTEERIPNRQETRYYRSQERRMFRKLNHSIYVIQQLQQRPTAHQMPKPERLYKKPGQLLDKFAPFASVVQR